MQLYQVTTIVNEYSGHKDVPFQWFVRYGGRIGEGPMSRFGVPYADLIDKYRAEDKNFYAHDAVDERFTADEAAALKEYLDREHGDAGETAIKQVRLPIPHIIMGLGAIAVGGGCDFYMLHKEQGYSLPFKAEAYYGLR
jgi:hypothetical protein